MPALLFVCTANQIRSPLAQELFKKLLIERNEQSSWRVESAGTWTFPDLPPLPMAVKAGDELGVDLRGHRSHIISGTYLAEFDLILVMEHRHKEALRTEFKEMAHKIRLLSEMVSTVESIPDPVSGGYQDYHDIASHIARILVEGFDTIHVEASTAKSKL